MNVRLVKAGRVGRVALKLGLTVNAGSKAGIVLYDSRRQGRTRKLTLPWDEVDRKTAIELVNRVYDFARQE